MVEGTGDTPVFVGLLILVCANAGIGLLRIATDIMVKISQLILKRNELAVNCGYFSIVVFHPWKMSDARDFEFSEHACDFERAEKYARNLRQSGQ